MSDKTQKQEMQDAKKENRIPKCISCNHDLKTILIRQGKQAESEIDEDSFRDEALEILNMGEEEDEE
jgi:hypothetical protein